MSREASGTLKEPFKVTGSSGLIPRISLNLSNATLRCFLPLRHQVRYLRHAHAHGEDHNLSPCRHCEVSLRSQDVPLPDRATFWKYQPILAPQNPVKRIRHTEKYIVFYRTQRGVRYVFINLGSLQCRTHFTADIERLMSDLRRVTSCGRSRSLICFSA